MKPRSAIGGMLAIDEVDGASRIDVSDEIRISGGVTTGRCCCCCCCVVVVSGPGAVLEWNHVRGRHDRRCDCGCGCGCGEVWEPDSARVAANGDDGDDDDTDDDDGVAGAAGELGEPDERDTSPEAVRLPSAILASKIRYYKLPATRSEGADGWTDGC